MSGYTRQSTATIVAGAIVRATPLNNEFDALQTAFGAISGHTHDGSVGNAPPINLTTSVTGILPAANGGTGLNSIATFVTLTGTQTLTNKTLTSPTINGGTITGITDLAVADGGTGASNAADARTNLGLVIGTNVQAYDADLTAIAALTPSDNNFIVGNGTAWVAESGATARTSMGVGTGDSPQFTGIELGHTSDTTITRASAGVAAIEGNNILTANNIGTLVQAYDADLSNWANKTAPSGTVVGTTDTQTLTNKTIEAGTFTNGYTEEVYTSNTGTSLTIDLANGTIQILTLTGNCTYTFPANTAGQSFLLIQKQDGTGSRTVTWDSDVKWPSSTAPTLTSNASKADVFAFTCDGTYWYGRVIGQLYL